MITCIKCGGFISHDSSNLSSICPDCARVLADDLSLEDLRAMAKVGLDALIDETTKYQDVRPKGDLARRYKRYKKERKAL